MQFTNEIVISLISMFYYSTKTLEIIIPQIIPKLNIKAVT